jgi:hypothetical protein
MVHISVATGRVTLPVLLNMAAEARERGDDDAAARAEEAALHHLRALLGGMVRQ